MKRAFLLSLVGIVGCANTHSGYFCVSAKTCDLPEKVSEGKALIYIIRPTSIFNNAEVHGLYISNGKDQDKYIGSYSGPEYCSYQANPGLIEVRTTGGNKESSIRFTVESGRTYYIEHSVTSTIFSNKLNSRLVMVDATRGNYLLSYSSGKCVQRSK